MIFQNYIFMFHVNPQGCSDQDDIFKFHQLLKKCTDDDDDDDDDDDSNRVDAQVVCQVGASTRLKHSVHDQVFIRWAHWSGCTLSSEKIQISSYEESFHFMISTSCIRI